MNYLENHPLNFNADYVNVAAYLPQRAKINPGKIAVAFPQSRDSLGRTAWVHLTYLQLEQLSNQYANGLQTQGITRGTRTLLMVRPGLDFIALAFALFKLGAVPVLIDPGMGVRKLLECVREISPEALIAIPEALIVSYFCRGSFSSVKINIWAGRKSSWLPGTSTTEFIASAATEFPLCKTAPDETAAILFTSGSTGPAKGVVYQHGMFEAQVQQLLNHYKITPDEVEMPGLPIFALFSPALGISCILPRMDPTRPSRVDPAEIVTAVNDFSVTNTFGSPAIWNRVVAYCLKHHLKLKSLKRVLMAGAPVPPGLIAAMKQILTPEAEIHTPYGATEALPVSDSTSRQILDQKRVKIQYEGGGTFIGRPLPGMSIKIIQISEDPISGWSTDLICETGEIGEIVVSGPVVTREYYQRPSDTSLAKIFNPETGVLWHRMGDLGYFDDEGCLWFVGRKAHRVVTPTQTLYSACVEAIFNRHPEVSRSALIGAGKPGQQIPAVVVEPRENSYSYLDNPRKQNFIKELADLARSSKITESIELFYFEKLFPTDIRHNVKISREKLAAKYQRNILAVNRLSD